MRLVERESTGKNKAHQVDLLVEREQGNQKKVHREDGPAKGPFYIRKDVSKLLDFSFLTNKFYEDYKQCSEIEQKPTRPYIRVTIEVDGNLFAIPLRSNINHPHVLWTDKENKCGVDFSKAVIITNTSEYIDTSRKPHIRQNEFDSLRGKDHQIKEKMKHYIEQYKKAKTRPDIPRNKKLLQCSTLQYFESDL